MKPIILACLLMFFECSLSLGATDCKALEYGDRTEVVCIGDEKAGAETSSPSRSSQAIVAENLAQRPLQTPSQATTAPSAESPQQVTAPTAEESQQSAAPASKPETAAEHLDKRRGLATRNTRNLMNYTSASAPQGQ